MDYIDNWNNTTGHNDIHILYVYENKKKRESIMNLPLSAIIMLIFGSFILYGGLVYFIYRAWKSNK